MKKLNLCFAIIIATVFFSCSKKEDKDEVQPTKLSFQSFVTGYDEFGSTEIEKKDFKVELLGTTISSITDAYGKFKLEGIETGNYKLKISKSGYLDYYSLISFGTAGGNQPLITSYSYNVRKPSTTILSAAGISLVYPDPSSSYNSDTIVQIQVIIPNSTTSGFYGRSARVFLSTKSNVSSKDYLYSFSTSDYSSYGSSSSLKRTIWSLYNFQREFKFKKGQTVYAIFYPVSGYDGSNWEYDKDTGLRIYRNITPNPSSVTSIIIP